MSDQTKYTIDDLYMCIPGSVHNWTGNNNDVPVEPDVVNVDVYKRNKTGEYSGSDVKVGYLVISYRMWDILDSESLSGVGDSMSEYFKSNFNRIIYN
jgi:hypothetical protein